MKIPIPRSENVNIPLFAGGLLIISSFVPVPQIIMLYGNGAFLFPFEKIFNSAALPSLNYLNVFFGMIFLIAYLFAKKTGYKILWTLLSVFFIHGFICFSEIVFTHGGDTDPYFAGFMISGIIAVLPLLGMGIIKENIKAFTSKQLKSK